LDLEKQRLAQLAFAYACFLPLFCWVFFFSFQILVGKLICLMCAVEALREIATQLGKKDWNFSVNPCNDSSWITPPLAERPLYNNTVNCNCSYPDGVCHVVSMYAPSSPNEKFNLKCMDMMCNLVEQH
jgi:hypothetical protein